MKTDSTFRKMVLSLLFIAGICISATNPPVQVKGTVTDATDNSPLKGVVIKIKNTQTTSTSDPQGHYSIMAKKGEILIFSLSGFSSREIRVTSVRHNIRLHPDRPLKQQEIIRYVQQESTEEAVMDVSVSYGSDIASEPRTNICPSMAKVQVFQENDNEEYGKFTPNNFIPVPEQPLSTFSIDVDAASYANMRRFINNGSLPPANAIRTEELINYFPYTYPQPSGQHPVSITTEVAGCPWNKEHRLVHIGLKAKDIDRNTLPASNLVFLVDVSGSMSSANKLPLLISSMKLLVKQLRDKDRVAIVTYAGYVKEILPSTPGNNKTVIIEALEQLTAKGSTSGEGGIKKAYQVARQNFIKGGNNRVILATDGDFNVGVSSQDELGALIEQQRTSGIFLTVLGYGMGNYKDNRMQMLAQKGNGNHAYIDNLPEAKKVLVNEFGGTLFTVAKDVKLQIEFNPAKVQAYRLIGYESRLLNKEDFNDDKKDAGEIGAGHTVTALYEIIPTGVAGMVDKLKYQTTMFPAILTNSPELLTVKLRYKQPDSERSLKMEKILTDQQLTLEKNSENFRFSAAVAGFGMLLNHSPHLKDLTFEQVANLARKSIGEDPEGYRKEFIRLVETAGLLTNDNK